MFNAQTLKLNGSSSSLSSHSINSLRASDFMWPFASEVSAFTRTPSLILAIASSVQVIASRVSIVDRHAGEVTSGSGANVKDSDSCPRRSATTPQSVIFMNASFT